MSVLAATLATIVATGPVEAGPALAGEGVAWGEVSRAGAVRVLYRAPDEPRRLVHRIAPATARRTARGFMHLPASFAASAEAFAALTYTATTRQDSSDSVSSIYTLAAVGGPLRGAAGLLAGAIPARGDSPCATPRRSPEAVDVDGTRIAVASSTVCEGQDAPQALAVSVHDRAAVTTLPVAGEFELGAVALAGDHVAWIADDREIVVHDLARRAAVLRITAEQLRARTIEDVALQADGTIAFTYDRGRLGVAAPGTPGVRVLARRAAFRGIGLAAGRVLYGRVLDSDPYRVDLVVRAIAGGPARRLARFDDRRAQRGDVDLDATRAAWAWQPKRRGYEGAPTGPVRVVVRGL